MLLAWSAAAGTSSYIASASLSGQSEITLDSGIVDSCVYLNFDSSFPHNQETHDVVVHLKLTSPDGKVFDLSRTIVVHPPK